jgi:hypothetical protein
MMRIHANPNPNTVLQYKRIGKIVWVDDQISVYMPGMATDENKRMVRRIVNMFFIVSVEHSGDSVRGPRLLVHTNQLILSRLECLSRQ